MTKPHSTTPVRIGYFGKIPGHDDFVKGTDNAPLISVLDDWLAQTMSLLSADLRWKLLYDAIRPFNFAFIGPRRKRAIAGHIIASRDQAQRRFPFLTMSTMEIDEPASFVAYSPLALARLWARLEAQSAATVAATDPAAALQNLAANSLELDLSSAAYEAAFNDFLELQTLGALDAMLLQAGFRGNLRQLLLALGLLLQPVLASSSSRLEKSLVLPLPSDPMYRYLVAAFWLHLITPFLQRADFELAVLLPSFGPQPSLVVGFGGASARTLHAIIDPAIGAEQHIAFDDAQWVEAQLDSDYGIKKLSTYLVQPNLSLKSALDSFNASFIGS